MKPRHNRLWPLLFLPPFGSLAGFYAGIERLRLPFGLGPFDSTSAGAFGLLAGCGVMVISASVVLAYRVAQRRFTIGAILAAIAVIAVLLACARSVLP
jgi:hypothetical protein